MEVGNLLLDLTKADIVVLDKWGKIALLVEVKGKFQGIEAKQRGISQLNLYFQNVNNINISYSQADDLFGMLAHTEYIEIFKWKNDVFLEPIISLKTADILSHYEPEFTSKRILGLYMETLIEAWLRDLAYHWKSETPPASKELAEIGLLQRLEGGDTYSQVSLGADTLR